MKTETSVHIRSVVLPVEHGGWAFLFEPMLAGFLLAPSVAGFLLSVSALGVFLIHQPLKIAVKDRLKARRYTRTLWAERFALLYSVLALAGFGFAFLIAGSVFLVPIFLAQPFACIQLLYDARNQGRDTIPEICGAVALSALAPAMTLIQGWSLQQALLLWLIFIARGVTSILYVRTRLRLEKGRVVDTKPAIGTHLMTVMSFIALSLMGMTPKLVVGAAAVLFIRAAYGLSAYRRPSPAKIIGFQEIGYGLLTVVVTVIGYRLPF